MHIAEIASTLETLERAHHTLRKAHDAISIRLKPYDDAEMTSTIREKGSSLTINTPVCELIKARDLVSATSKDLSKAHSNLTKAKKSKTEEAKQTCEPLPVKKTDKDNDSK